MKRLLIVSASVVGVLVLALFAAVVLTERTPIEQKNHPLLQERFSLIAHRGGSLERPENTLVSFDHASKLHPRIWLEFDVSLTRDGEPIIMHDETVDRTTDGSGIVFMKTMAEIKKLDAGYKFTTGDGNFPYRGKGLKVPTLREIFQRYPKSRMVVEIKDKQWAALDKTIALIEEFKASDRIVLASFHEHIIKDARKKRPAWVFNTPSTEAWRDVMLTGIGLPSLAPYVGDFLMIPLKEKGIPVYTKALQTEAHRRHHKVVTWIINDEITMRDLIAQGVDGIITDAPTKLLEVAKSSELLATVDKAE